MSADLELSARLASMFSARSVLLVSRAALGLVAVLKCWCQLNGRAACKVALPAAVCHEVVLAVLEAGCEPAFCDVSVADGLVPESEWSRARASGAEVAIVVHLYGNPASVSLARAHFPLPSCLVIDDAAQALGTRTAEGLRALAEM